MIISTTTPELLETAKGISDYGMATVTAASFIVVSTSLMITFFASFKQSMAKMLAAIHEITAMRAALSRINDSVEPFAERARMEVHTCVENYIDTSLDLAVERVCRLIKDVRQQNHIADREATTAKVRNNLKNIHDERNVQFAYFQVNGKQLATYCRKEWVDTLAEVVLNEIYHPGGANDSRAYRNVSVAYDQIKVEILQAINR